MYRGKPTPDPEHPQAADDPASERSEAEPVIPRREALKAAALGAAAAAATPLSGAEVELVCWSSSFVRSRALSRSSSPGTPHWTGPRDEHSGVCHHGGAPVSNLKSPQECSIQTIFRPLVEDLRKLLVGI